MLRGLQARIAHEAQVAVHRAEAPLACVVLGAGRILEELDDLAQLFTHESTRR